MNGVRTKKDLHRVTVYIIILNSVIKAVANEGVAETEETKPKKYEELGDHTMVTDNEIFPYAAAVLKKTKYISAGALIDDSWVLTAADALFLMRDATRIIRVRLGSINNKKGGVLMPIKYFQIHPNFDDNKPQFDIALIRLSEPVSFTTNLNPIRMQVRPKNTAASHFIVIGWPMHPEVPFPKERQHRESMEVIKRRRLLSVSHLHPTNPEKCSEQLSISGLNDSKVLMCLNPAVGTDPCERQPGAPVVLHGILWGIISSWKPEDCEVDSGLTFVNLVSAKEISTWIKQTRLGVLSKKQRAPPLLTYS